MDNIAALVAEAREQPLPSFIPRSEIIRELAEPARFNLVEIITGMRRSGKTFYLYQKMSQLLEAGVPRDRLFYFDFADDRLSPLAPDTMASVIEEFWRQVPEARTEGCYLFLDEAGDGALAGRLPAPRRAREGDARHYGLVFETVIGGDRDQIPRPFPFP